jgi:hypothetical protein
MKITKYRSWNEQAKCFIYFMNGFYYDAEWVQGCFDFSWANAEQFTGLHDKNDKDIYDGDIWSRGGYCGVVVFAHSQWEFEKTKSSGHYEYPAFWSQANSGGVIGNIQENPELVK